MTSVDDQACNAGAAEVLAGGGEMGALMRALDWTATPLGPVESWPQALKTCVRLLLTSRQPMWLGWGKELTFLYNDPYRSIVGGKHPQALGQPTAVVWREIWADIAPRIRSALGGDEGTYDEALLLIMERHGYREETYYTFSYSPIPDDEGRVAGIFCANTDDTRRVIGERQLTLLRDLAASTAEARTVDDACVLSMRGLETNPHDLPFALIYLLDAQQRRASLCGTVRLARSHPAAPATIALDDSAVWPIADVVATGAPGLVSDLDALCGALPTGAWDRPPAQAVALPIVPSSQSGPLGVLIVGLNPYRLFDDGYSGFLGLVAGQIATAIAGARAYEEERRRAEALAELDRAKTAFFNNVSHEFRTPLTLMLGPLEDVLAAPTDADLVREQVAAAHRNSLRLLRLVNTLLDFSRVEGARMEAVYEPTDLAALTAELAGVFRSAAERAGLRLRVDCPPLPQPVYVDHEMWEKIVLNLLSNAFKFTFEGEIAVGLRAEGEHLTLTVRDTGTGIAAAELPHLFERFHRVRGARARTHEGTGIGLALAHDLVRLHGGEIEVQSAPGVGSTFTVRLPLGTAHLPAERIGAARTQVSTALGAAPYVEEALRWLPAAGGASEPQQVITDVSPAAVVAAESGETKRARVLLADDNADLRDYLTRLLAARYDVQAVSNGAQALQAARAQLPDLVLSDVMMSELDGFGLLRALRADPRTRAVPVLLLSARAGEESTVEGLQAGADDYLVKPFSARELLARVQTHVELARARTHLARLQQITAALSAATTVEEVADVIITHGLEALGATVGVVAMCSADGDSFTNVRVTGYTPEVVAAWPGFSADAAVPIADAVRAREPVILASREEHDARYPHLAGAPSMAGDGALVAIPLLLRERVIGGLRLSFPHARQFSTEERAMMGALGELCAQALERARLYEAERQAGAEAEAGRQRLGEIFQQAPAMIAVLRGPQHVFEVANDLYQRGSGRAAADLVGRSIREALPELEGQGFYELLDEVYLTGQPHVASETLVRLHRAEATRLEDVYFTFTYQPLHNAAGAVEGIVVLAVDVTTQVQARQRTEELARQVQEERDRWRQVLDVLPVGVVIVDAHGRVEVLNQAGRDIVGHDTRGQPLPAADQIDDEYRVRRPDGTAYPPSEVPLYRSLLYGEEVHGDQELHRHAVTGRQTPLLVNSAPLRDAGGAIVGAIAIFQDITALRELERAREEFLSSAAHDLKTPLTGIRGQAQLAQRRLARLDSPETAPVLGQLTRIQEGADAMLGLINELMDVARQQMGVGLDLYREPTNLVALVQGGVEAQRDASGRTIHLEMAVPELHADVDAARIARVVGNLLSNALKYSSAGSAIWVRLEQATGPGGPEAVLTVRDEGIGIPAADLPYIFDRFQRASNVAAHIQGTGIGLASARGIVEQHGGTITVESSEGSGSTFTVRLPLRM